jgi:hypothetical protein
MVGVDTKASTCPVAAALASSLAPCSIAMDNSRGRGPGWGARTSGGQRMRQNVALWNFTALASARACSQSSDPPGMAAVGAPWAFRR